MRTLYNICNIFEIICLCLLCVKMVRMDISAFKLRIQERKLPEQFHKVKKSKTEQNERIYIPVDIKGNDVDINEYEELAKYMDIYYEKKRREKSFFFTLVKLGVFILLVEVIL